MSISTTELSEKVIQIGTDWDGCSARTILAQLLDAVREYDATAFEPADSLIEPGSNPTRACASVYWRTLIHGAAADTIVVGGLVLLVEKPTGCASKDFPLTVGKVYRVRRIEGSNVVTDSDDPDVREVSYNRERVRVVA